MAKAQVYRIIKHFQGNPKDSDFELRNDELPALKDGEVLYKAEYLSVDPYMRLYTNRIPEGSIMIGEQLAKVVQSKNSKYPVGTFNLVNCGWRSHTVIYPETGTPRGEGYDQNTPKMRIKPLPRNIDGLPISLSLGTVGMPGATAYCTLVKDMKIQAGKVILVNAAAGATGQVACQVAKNKGCKVIGCAGSKEKCDFLRSIGVDVVFNYKTEDLAAVLTKAAPDGINYYLDGVGGEFSRTAFKHMAPGGFVVIIGCIESYNKTAPSTQGDLPTSLILGKTMTVKGSLVTQYPASDWVEAFDNITKWIKEGKFQYQEHVTEGFENMRKAFYQLFTGENNGKAVVKANLPVVNITPL